MKHFLSRLVIHIWINYAVHDTISETDIVSCGEPVKRLNNGTLYIKKRHLKLSMYSRRIMSKKL